MLQKANSYYLLLTYLILKQRTNENKSLSTEEVSTIIQKELRMDQKIDKRTIQSHFERLATLTALSIDEQLSFFKEEVILEGDRAYVLHTFDETEVRLLADIIAFSKLINQQTSLDMIEKLYALGGEKMPYKYEEQLRYKLNESVHNPQLFFTVEKLAQAFQKKAKVALTYLTYNEEMELVPLPTTKGEMRRVISPHSIIWSSNYYYVLCIYEDSDKVYFLRTDKMKDLEVLEKDSVHPLPNGFSIYEYVKTQSHLFGGRQIQVSFTAERWLLDPIIDTFGAAAKIKAINDQQCRITVHSSFETMEVWLIQYITGVSDVYPANLQKTLKHKLQKAIEAI